jgi:hypothetical protein
MAEKKQPPAVSPPAKPAADRKPRKHGYRGYGSGIARGSDSYGGTIHVPSGFAGVGTLEPPPPITPVTRRGR